MEWLGGHLTAALPYLWGGQWGYRTRFFTAVHGRKLRDELNKHKLKQERFAREESQAVEQGAEEIVLSLSLKVVLDKALSSLVWCQSWPLFGQEVGLETLVPSNQGYPAIMKNQKLANPHSERTKDITLCNIHSPFRFTFMCSSDKTLLLYAGKCQNICELCSF